MGSNVHAKTIHMRKEIRDFQEKLGLPANMKAFSRGNSKLPKDTLIVNHTTALDCPAYEYCLVGDKCYARRCERRYKKYRERNLIIENFYNTGAISDFLLLIEMYCKDANGNVIIKNVRLNEAGDFKDQQAVNVFSLIAKILKRDYDINTYAYSARIDLDFRGVAFVLNASRPEIDAYDRIFKATHVEEFNMLPKKAIKCAADCTKCSICTRKGSGYTVYCKMH